MMTRILVGTDAVTTSERLVAYLTGVVDENDMVFVVNSLHGGEETGPEEVSDGKAALNAIEDDLDSGMIETHQFIRGNEPIEDLLQAATDFDIDEIVIGIRKRTPVGKLVFGSTARDLLLEADRPVRCIPLAST